MSIRRFVLVWLFLLAPAVALDVSPRDDLQAALAKADATREDVRLLPGDYLVTKPLRSQSTIHADRGAAIRWRGPEMDGFVLTLSSQGGGAGSPFIDGHLLVDCQRKIGGVLLRDLHDVSVSGLFVFGAKGAGIETVDAWFLHLRELRVSYGTGTAYKLAGLSNASARGIVAAEYDGGESPVVVIEAGIGILENVCVERCKSKVAIVDAVLNQSSLRGWSSENLEAPVLIRVHDSTMPTLEMLSFWQREDLPSTVEVLLQKCHRPKVENINSYNCRDAVLRFDACRQPQYDRINRQYDLIDRPDYGVRPRYMVDVR